MDLSDQVSNASFQQMVLNENNSSRDNLNLETNKRKCEVVRKGIEQTEKQLRQLILNDIQTDSMDISLIKKYKTVDVPCIHSAIGNIQKSLQRYVKFSGVDSECCDKINDLLDDAENWCLRVEVLYNKAEIHSINTSKGDTAEGRYFLIMPKLPFMNSLKLLRLHIWAGGTLSRKLTDCITGICRRK